LIFTAVADDDTGATDLAGMLADNGVRTVLVLDDDPQRWAEGFDALVLGAGTRALPPAEAYSRTAAAVQKLWAIHPRVLEIKYCSTFDSTAEGNIGQSIDAAMDITGVGFTVALPALPVNGRTTYLGHHFVNGQLLSDSPMRDHPLNPMRNSNLVSHLQTQTRRRVGLARYPVTRDALKALESDGVEIAVLDCVDDADLTRVCEAIAELRLISGSSAPAMRLPVLWRERGWWQPRQADVQPRSHSGHGVLIVSGSCSQATRLQNQWFAVQGGEVQVFDPIALLEGAAPPITQSATALVRISAEPADRRRVHDWSISHGHTAASAGLQLAAAFARRVAARVATQPPAGLIVAGGETSTAVCRALRLGALEVGRNIQPGVPVCFPLGGEPFQMVLKSGNFGSPDFYGVVINRIQGGVQ